MNKVAVANLPISKVTYFYNFTDTVNSEIFVRILFSRNALKEVFDTLNIRDKDMLYPHQ